MLGRHERRLGQTSDGAGEARPPSSFMIKELSAVAHGGHPAPFESLDNSDLPSAPLKHAPAPASERNTSDIGPLHPQTWGMTKAAPSPRPSELDAATLAEARAPGVGRRLATMLYDLLLLFGVVVMAAALYFGAFQLITGSERIEGGAMFLFRAYLLVVVVGYYLYFWTGGRQTLGMRSWRTQLVRSDGAPLGIADALRRLLFSALTIAPAGAGLLWALFDRDGLAGYDRLSATRPVLTLKPGQRKR